MCLANRHNNSELLNLLQIQEIFVKVHLNSVAFVRFNTHFYCLKYRCLIYVISSTPLLENVMFMHVIYIVRWPQMILVMHNGVARLYAIGRRGDRFPIRPINAESISQRVRTGFLVDVMANQLGYPNITQSQSTLRVRCLTK